VYSEYASQPETSSSSRAVVYDLELNLELDLDLELELELGWKVTTMSGQICRIMRAFDAAALDTGGAEACYTLGFA